LPVLCNKMIIFAKIINVKLWKLNAMHITV